jgi:hypothetical protein
MKIWIMHHYAVNDTGDFEKDLAQYKDLINKHNVLYHTYFKKVNKL